MKLLKRIGEVFSKIWLMLALGFTVSFPSVMHAARPFHTDDAGTVGKNGFQVETGIEYSSKKDYEDDVKIKETETGLLAALTFGITDNLDVIAGLPYVWKKKENHHVNFDKNKLSDVTLEAKWRLYERGGLGIAVKPGISLTTGDYREDFGTGRATYGIILIFSQDFGSVGLHFNGGYTRNENKVCQRKDLFSTSFAFTYEVIKNLTIGGDIGISKNTDPKTKTAPAFFLFGGSYKTGKYITIDAGAKWGLNRYGIDHAFIGGITFKF